MPAALTSLLSVHSQMLATPETWWEIVLACTTPPCCWQYIALIKGVTVTGHAASAVDDVCPPEESGNTGGPEQASWHGES